MAGGIFERVRCSGAESPAIAPAPAPFSVSFPDAGVSKDTSCACSCVPDAVGAAAFEAGGAEGARAALASSALGTARCRCCSAPSGNASPRGAAERREEVRTGLLDDLSDIRLSIRYHVC